MSKYLHPFSQSNIRFQEGRLGLPGGVRGSPSLGPFWFARWLDSSRYYPGSCPPGLGDDLYKRLPSDPSSKPLVVVARLGKLGSIDANRRTLSAELQGVAIDDYWGLLSERREREIRRRRRPAANNRRTIQRRLVGRRAGSCYQRGDSAMAATTIEATALEAVGVEAVGVEEAVAMEEAMWSREKIVREIVGYVVTWRISVVLIAHRWWVWR